MGKSKELSEVEECCDELLERMNAEHLVSMKAMDRSVRRVVKDLSCLIASRGLDRFSKDDATVFLSTYINIRDFRAVRGCIGNDVDPGLETEKVLHDYFMKASMLFTYTHRDKIKRIIDEQ